jgi:hypothetical protein
VCEAVYEVHGQPGVRTTHPTAADVAGDLRGEAAGQLTVDVCIEEAPVAEMVESRHARRTR